MVLLCIYIALICPFFHDNLYLLIYFSTNFSRTTPIVIDHWSALSSTNWFIIFICSFYMQLCTSLFTRLDDMQSEFQLSWLLPIAINHWLYITTKVLIILTYVTKYKKILENTKLANNALEESPKLLNELHTRLS